MLQICAAEVFQAVVSDAEQQLPVPVIQDREGAIIAPPEQCRHLVIGMVVISFHAGLSCCTLKAKDSKNRPAAAFGTLNLRKIR